MCITANAGAFWQSCFITERPPHTSSAIRTCLMCAYCVVLISDSCIHPQELRCASSGLLSLSIDDAGIARLPGLTELFVSGNRIHSLAPVQQAFPALETLDISSNEVAFEDISRCVACLPSLLSLQFQGNPLPVPAE